MTTEMTAGALWRGGLSTLLSRAARSLVMRRFASLSEGRLMVEDPLGAWQCGEAKAQPVRLWVHDPRFYVDLLRAGSLGAARAYLDGLWSADDLVGLFRMALREPALSDGLEGGWAHIAGWGSRLRHRSRANTRAGARRNVAEHYDLGNDFFALFLDRTLTYSAGIFTHPQASLEEAQTEKLDRICRKLGLGPGDHVLEIGTGWGSFAIHAASRYGCRVTTTTISEQQHALARERIAAAGVADRVRALLADYRDLDGRYDKLVSIEMIEAVGHERLPAYFAKCASLLEPAGAMLVQAITMPDRRYHRYLQTSDFIREHVFPGSCVPSLSAMLEAARDASDLRLVHLEDIGPHYATTLRRWRERFEARAPAVRALGYRARFLRLWGYYLCYCEAGFAERYLGDLQLLFHRPACRAAPLLPALPGGPSGELEA